MSPCAQCLNQQQLLSNLLTQPDDTIILPALNTNVNVSDVMPNLPFLLTLRH
jgi:putative heme iron utilization protein